MTRKYWESFGRVGFGESRINEYAIKDPFLYVVTNNSNPEFPKSTVFEYDLKSKVQIPCDFSGVMYRFNLIKNKEEVDNGWGF